MLRQLAMYYHKDANNLFMVRLAQVSCKAVMQSSSANELGYQLDSSL